LVAVSAGLLAAQGALWLASALSRRSEPAGGLDPSRLPAAGLSVSLEQVMAAAWVTGAGLVAVSELLGGPGKGMAVVAVGVLFGLALAAVGLAPRWRVGWLAYAAQAATLGAYLVYRHAFPLPAATDAFVLTLFGYLDLGLAEVMQRLGQGLYARPTRYASLVLPLLPLALAFGGGLEPARLFVVLAAATFYAVACYTLQWRSLGYAAAVLYNAFLWVVWARFGWTVADAPPYYLVPVGLTAVLFAEVNRRDFGRESVNAIRGLGLTTAYLSLAYPVWESQNLASWAGLLLLSLAGVFAGIGLRVQVFLWLGLTGFVLDVVYQLGRMGMENSLAKWAIMLALGVGLVLFVALNEKKKVVQTMKELFAVARQWE
jgi:hypothetical protein